LKVRHVAALAITVLAAAGCGGGGGGGALFNTGSPPPTQSTQSGSVGASGGSVSVTLGAQTVTITAPNGALSGTGTLSITLYAPSAAPTALSKVRKTKTIAADATLLSEFTVTLTGATLIKPLAASFTIGGPASGDIFRLAGDGTKFDDVDTVSWANGTATTDQNTAYPRMSLASGTTYALYMEPQAEATGAPTPAITVTSNTANPIGMLSTATFTAKEVDPNNGFPYLDPNFTFGLSNGSLGTIAPSTGVLTTGPVDGSGNVTATDTTAGRGNPKGSVAITVSSERPGNTGDAFSYTGTLSSTTQLTNSNITTQPQTSSGTVALNSTVPGFTAAAGGGGTNEVRSTEVDTYTLNTLTTKTVSNYQYATAGLTGTLSILKSSASDSDGATTNNTYGTGNGLLDVLPETAGSFGPNNAALTTVTVDPAGYHGQRGTAADGSYSEVDADPLGDVQTITGKADFSATYDASQYSGYKFVITKPSSAANPTITMTIYRGSTVAGSLTIPSWIPSSLTQPSVETDADTAAVTYPSGCSVPAKYGTSGNKIVQTIERVDPALGNLETETTTTYTAPSVGPVCIQMNDDVGTYYDYTLQNGYVVYVSGNAQPVQVTSMSETLTLQSATTGSGTTTSSLKRGSSTVRGSAFTPSALAPVAFARAHFEQQVHAQLAAQRKATFNKSFLSQGVKSL
jgi:hypothetical protein